MKIIQETGDNLFNFVEINSDDDSVGSITQRIQITGTVSFFSASIYSDISHL